MLNWCALLLPVMHVRSVQDTSRRTFFSQAGAAAVSALVLPGVSFAEEAAAPAAEKKPLGPAPTDWGMSKDYYTVSQSVVCLHCIGSVKDICP